MNPARLGIIWIVAPVEPTRELQVLHELVNYRSVMVNLW